MSIISFIFDIIRIPFGWLIRLFYSLTNSYLLAIIAFALVLKVVLFPLGIKQQKNSQRQAKLRPKENVIRKKYAGRNDRATQMKLNTEIQELYQKENFSPFSGCLPMLIQMLVLLAVYAVVRSPLTYTAGLPQIEGVDSVDTLKQTVSYMVFEEDAERPESERQIRNFVNIAVTERDEQKFYEALHAGSYNIYNEINVIQYIKANPEAFITYVTSHNSAVSETDAKALIEAIPELELFSGFSLGTDPEISFLTDKEAPVGKKLTLLVPLLTLVTAYFGQAITRKFTYQPETTPEQESQMKMMNLFMPLFSLYISFIVPTAVAIYWIIQNILNPVQQILLSKIFPIAEITPEEMREAERLYGGKVKKKKSSAGSGKKRRSLVYDDDDETESVSTVKEKKVLKEKKEVGENNVVDKAPLKED